MQKSKKKIEPIPDEFKTIMEASDFWDKHDITDYWDDTKKVKFRASLKKEPKYVALEESIAKKALAVAKEKRVSMETLVNLWLKEKLSATR
ncbi:MAG: CopG family antitoxin [Thermodesulfovibrionales bacterium]